MARKLTDLLPERYLNSPEVGAAAGIIWVLGEVFRARVLDWLAQLTIDTATWGIVHWEREYGVTPRATDTLDDRRSRVMAKLRAPQTPRGQCWKRRRGLRGGRGILGGRVPARAPRAVPVCVIRAFPTAAGCTDRIAARGHAQPCCVRLSLFIPAGAGGACAYGGRHAAAHQIDGRRHGMTWNTGRF